MAKKEKLYTVEITDIFEPEQEEAVIDTAGKWVKKNEEELQEIFKTTDTLVVKKLTESDAKTLVDALNGLDLTIRMYTSDEKVKQSANEIRCPKCGFVLEYQEWRCPECYYEFPDFELESDEEPEE
jgi:lipopolysaccharide biosynthesis regulator YciM